MKKLQRWAIIYKKDLLQAKSYYTLDTYSTKYEAIDRLRNYACPKEWKVVKISLEINI